MQQAPDHLAEIASTMLMLCAARGEDSTVCPSEVARIMDNRDPNWRALMPVVRQVAAELAKTGIIEVTQSGRPVDIAAARGPVRLRVKRKSA